MKKIILFLGLLMCLVGCSTIENNVVDELDKKINGLKGYNMVGTLEIYRNEDKYTYDVDSSYSKDDLYKVTLINRNNNHEQIILKNKEGVYVLTPSLNKSFKFQSEWPYNNSQIYLLQPIVLDLVNDKNSTVLKTDDGYIITSKVNYTTEKDFVSQKVYLDKNYNITKVEVLDSNDNVRMKLIIKNIDYDTKFEDGYFDESKYHKTTEKEEEVAKKIDDIVYPLYVPTDTYLTNQDIVGTTKGERVILTFSGEEPFTVIQETLNDTDTVNYVYGDPYLILDTIGTITDSSVSWISNGIEYSVISDTMPVSEIVTVAQSITVEASVK